MQTMDSSRTDKRIDDLGTKVDRLDGRVDEMNREMHAEFRAVRGEMRDGFDLIHARFDSMQRSMLWMMGTMLVVVASILAAAQF